MDDLTSLQGTGALQLGEPSLADAMAAVAGDTSLPESRRRHWQTSMKRIAEGIGRPPQSLPARLTALRHPIDRLNPVLMGIAPKSLANHKSNVRAAIVHFMRIATVPSRGAPLAKDWALLMRAIPVVKHKRLLSGIVRFCSSRGIMPANVDETVVEAYFQFRGETSLLSTSIGRRRELMRAWNGCVATMPDWLGRRLALPDLPPPSKGAEWTAFPAGLRQDVEAYLSQLAKPHRSANGKRRRPCKASTIATRREELIAFARKAVKIGIDIDTLVSLDALLAPAVVQPVMEAYAGGDGSPASRYAIDLAWKLLSIAKMIGASEETIETLEEIQEVLEAQRGELMTEKNMAVIRAVLATDMWKRVISLPHLLMQEAEQLVKRSPSKAASRAALAIQILLLTRAPVRVGNLMSIRLGHNLTRPGGPKSPYVLVFPGYDVKNRVDLTFPFTRESSALIDRYLKVFRHHLADHPSDWLFPGEGKARSPRHASVAMAERIKRETGMRITAHQFRHAAAALILKVHPGNYEYVRRVLGHLNVQTTIRFYIGLEGFQANEHFGRLIEEHLKVEDA
jgi:integrase